MPFKGDCAPMLFADAVFVPPTPAAIRQWCERYAPQYLKRRENDGLPADVRRFLGEM